MALKFPPPPQLTGTQWQSLNRWLIEIQSILNADGTVNIGNSPTLTGEPTAPTAAAGTDTDQIATTAFVLANSGGIPSTTVPLVDATPGEVGTSTHFARADHVHPTDASRAPLASPVFTGTPEGPTAALGTDTAQLATTSFVANADALLAPLASPVLTGTPEAPTAALGTDTTQIATTAFVLANASGGGAGQVEAWVNFVGSTGVINGSLNVSSVARASAGVYTVNFASAFPDTNYAVAVTTEGTGANGIVGRVSSQAVGSIGIATFSETFANTDPTGNVFVIVVGT